MNPQLKWLIQMALAVVGVMSLIDEGRRRGWI